MVPLEKAIRLNSQGILFGTPGDFAFSRKGMFKELFCHQLNVRRYSNLELWLSKGKFARAVNKSSHQVRFELI